jgi:recombination associated protein RdgC
MLSGLALTLVNTKIAPSTAMASWLVTQEAPAGFSVDRECELKAPDESKAVVRYTRHRLDTDEVKQHVEGGKVPTRLALTWNERVSFVLTQDLQLKKLAFLEVVFEGSSTGKDDGFDADVAIATGELCKMLPEVLASLGGELA